MAFWPHPECVDAVQWAADVQRAVQVQDAGDGLATDRAAYRSACWRHHYDRFRRVGDGVALAARLQEHAPAGGIVVSEAVHNLVRGSVGTAMRDLGPLDLKNFEHPVRAFALDIADHQIEVPHFIPRDCLRSPCCRWRTSAAIPRTIIFVMDVWRISHFLWPDCMSLW